MGKFKNKKREMGAISTASLPDIVFMLLFFFMVATVLRTEEEMVRVIRPEASEIYKIEKKHLIRYINIGPPQDQRYGTEPVIQLHDQFADVAQIREDVGLDEGRPGHQDGRGHRRQAGAPQGVRPEGALLREFPRTHQLIQPPNSASTLSASTDDNFT